MKNVSLMPIVFGLLGMLAAGCSALKENDDPTRNWSAAKLHTEARKELKDGNYDQASKLYEKLQSRYPYGMDSQQAELEQIYVYYKQHDATSATSEADRFIKAHPNNPSVDYAYYMKGLANFNDDLGIFGIYNESDIVQKDSKPTQQSFEAFRDLVNRFPNSRYTPDAILRMNYLVNSMAEKDIITARYYYRRQAYLAAANRAQEILKEYPRSHYVEEALFIMEKSYGKMGLPNLQQDTLEVLNKNYPNSKFFTQGDPTLEKPWWRLFW